MKIESVAALFKLDKKNPTQSEKKFLKLKIK